MELQGKKIAMIIASDGYRDEEYKVPREILEREKVSVTVFSSTTNVCRGKMGMTVKPDKLLKDLKVDDFDGVIFVGGPGATEYFNNQTAQMVARESFQKGKITSAICIAPTILAKAGILKDKVATAFQSEQKTLVAEGAQFTGKQVERTGNIITGSGPEAARLFGETIVSALKQAHARIS